METIVHPWPPVFDNRARILILGTIPSPKSRQNGFYYSHPQNLFWQILADLLAMPIPANSPQAKKEFLLAGHIAVFDVLYTCDIHGASDTSIRNPKVQDLQPILQNAPIQAVFTTGQKATALYTRFCPQQAVFPCHYLPSTSPANRANYPYEKLLAAWRAILPYLT